VLDPGAELETASTLEEDLNAIRSQLRRLLGTSKWYEDIGTVNGKKRSLLELNADLDRLEAEAGSPMTSVVEESFASGTDWRSQWRHCAGWSRLEIAVRWPDLAGVAGVLQIQGNALVTGDPELDTRFLIPEITANYGVFGTWPTVGATAGIAVIVINNPLSYMRLRFIDNDSPAAADHFTVVTTLS
jgi:hypothetical protein